MVIPRLGHALVITWTTSSAGPWAVRSIKRLATVRRGGTHRSLIGLRALRRKAHVPVPPLGDRAGPTRRRSLGVHSEAADSVGRDKTHPGVRARRRTPPHSEAVQWDRRHRSNRDRWPSVPVTVRGEPSRACRSVHADDCSRVNTPLHWAIGKCSWRLPFAGFHGKPAICC